MVVEDSTLEAESSASALRIFVYGTLKRGFCNHKHMENHGMQYVDDAITADPCVLYLDLENRFRPSLTDGWGACVVREDQDLSPRKNPLGFQVRGEVYDLPHVDALDMLDRFERVPNHYSRKEITLISCNTGYPMKAFVYYANISVHKWRKLETGEVPLMKEYTVKDHSSYVPRDSRTKVLGPSCSAKVERSSV